VGLISKAYLTILSPSSMGDAPAVDAPAKAKDGRRLSHGKDLLAM
jgi:hypothetical protein